MLTAVRALGQARIRVLTFVVICLPYKGTNLDRQSSLCPGFVNEKIQKSSSKSVQKQENLDGSVGEKGCTFLLLKMTHLLEK